MPQSIRPDAFLFGEAQSRIVVSVALQGEQKLLSFLEEKEIPCAYLGLVTEGTFRIGAADWGNVQEWKELYDGSLARLMESSPSR
jgi:phosphoribosylformylglycinamidine synthase